MRDLHRKVLTSSEEFQGAYRNFMPEEYLSWKSVKEINQVSSFSSLDATKCADNSAHASRSTRNVLFSCWRERKREREREGKMAAQKLFFPKYKNFPWGFIVNRWFGWDSITFLRWSRVRSCQRCRVRVVTPQRGSTVGRGWPGVPPPKRPRRADLKGIAPPTKLL
jgi:hypothetical protein